MKKKPTVLSILIPVLALTSCSQNTSINASQAVQIMDMIIYERYTNGDPRTFDECSYYSSVIEDGQEIVLCYYELSKTNNIIHVFNELEGVKEAWYYIDSNILYCATRGDDGELSTSILESGEEEALTEFNVHYYAIASDNAEKRIKEIDRPTNTKQRLTDLKSVAEENTSQKFRTKKNYHVSGDVRVYKDRFHKNFVSSFAFEYNEKFLTSLTYQNENSLEIYKFKISYNINLNINSIK